MLCSPAHQAVLPSLRTDEGARCVDVQVAANAGTGHVIPELLADRLGDLFNGELTLLLLEGGQDCVADDARLAPLGHGTPLVSANPRRLDVFGQGWPVSGASRPRLGSRLQRSPPTNRSATMTSSSRYGRSGQP